MAEISIGLPVYNGEKLIGEAIESVLGQSYADFELVIADNASSDNTEYICRDFAKHDSRIRYVRNPKNIGAAANFRKVFGLSTSKYYKWIGVDDYCDQNYLEDTKRILDQRQEVVLCCSKVKIIDGNGAVLRDYEDSQCLLETDPIQRFKKFQTQDSWVNCVYGLMRSDALRQTSVMGTFPGSDIVVMAEMALHGQFHELPDYLFFRRIHPDAFSYECSTEKQQEFYNPGEQNRFLPLYHWRHLVEYIKVSGRAPLGFGERCRLLSHIFRMLRWQRTELFGELRALIR